MSIAVSVLVPVYNDAPYLCRCLDSVLGQTLANIEVICVDDGSTDASGTILDGYAAKDGRVSVVHQANAGPGPARNVAINRADGEFIAFMDGDDYYYDEHALQTLYDAAKEHNVNVVGGQLYEYDGNDFTEVFPLRSEPSSPICEATVVSYADFPITWSCTRFLYRRELLVGRGVYFPDLARSQDAVFTVRSLAEAREVLSLPVPIYMYMRVNRVKPVLLRPSALLGWWRYMGIGLSIANGFCLAKLRDLLVRSMQSLTMHKFLTYRYILRGNTTVAEVWGRVVRTAKDEGFYDPRLFLTDPGEMRDCVEDTVARCHELKRTLAAAKSVVVYGAGQVGQRAARFIRDCNPKLSLGFAVSAGQPHEATVMGLPVRAIDEVSPGDGTLIVLAVGEKLRPEMSANLRRLGLRFLQINHNLSPDIVRCVEILESEP